jgi:putative ABC transport system substrate-binding protein
VNRRGFLYGALSTTLTASRLAASPPAGKLHRIGFLAPTAAPAAEPLLDAFRQALLDLGWADGRDVVIESRWAEGSLDRLTDLAAELVQAGVDVLVTQGTPGAHAGRHVTRTIPVVMVAVDDPVGSGLARSRGRPGGNLTGLSLMAPQLGARRLELLKEAVTGLARVGVLWNAYSLYPWQVVGEIEKAAGALRLQIERLEVRFAKDLDPVFEMALLRRVEALLIVEDPFTVAQRARIVDFAAQGRVPAIYGSREFVDAGGLMMYGPDLGALFRRAAGYVDRILKGARPADLPIEGPTRFELIVNLKAAGPLGLTFPTALLRRADQVRE